MNRVWIRGDTHGNYNFLSQFCKDNNTTINDILIILGDSALRFEGANSNREVSRCQFVSKLPITIIALRGNHDRPYFTETGLLAKELCALPATMIPSFDVMSDNLFHDMRYPNIWYFKDGGHYIINNYSILTIGGAYSVDKEYRQMMHRTWYSNEQLSYTEQSEILNNITGRVFDIVLTHTCPYDWRPTDLFLPFIDQSKVDNSMEIWLNAVKDNIKTTYWLFGHYHDDRIDILPGVSMLFEQYLYLGKNVLVYE